MARIVDHTDRDYVALRKMLNTGKYNGAYYYSQEIVKNIIPNVKTDRPWNTLGMRSLGLQRDAIVFLHHNLNWEKVYGWMKGRYKNNIFVVNTQDTYNYIKSQGWPVIFLPLSIDVEYVQQFKTKKTKEVCHTGNRWSFIRQELKDNIPANVDYPPDDLPREELLKFVAPYRKCYAIGRCALEALALGCEIMPFYHKWMEPSYWKLLSNQNAAVLLQKALGDIERGANAVDCCDYPDYNNMV